MVTSRGADCLEAPMPRVPALLKVLVTRELALEAKTPRVLDTRGDREGAPLHSSEAWTELDICLGHRHALALHV